MTGGKIAVAMSGGVDSSTAALILKEDGWEPIGFSMKLWSRDSVDSSGTEIPAGGSQEEFPDARQVAALLNIPHHVVDLRQDFERTIVRVFMEEYRRGYTPSPCVNCNAQIKFDRLIRMARDVGARHVATGHYARVAYDEESSRYLLLRAKDRSKDQAYFLSRLSQDQLAKAVFPLGNLTKRRVRETARMHGLPVSEKSESQEICFIPDGDYAAFIERRYLEAAGRSGDGSVTGAPFLDGPIVDVEGHVLGRHRGIHRYTIGQRRGLGIAHSSPLYVLEIDPDGNRIITGERSQLMKNRCNVVSPNWISIPALMQPLYVQAKIRSRHPAASAVISPRENGSVDVLFDVPQPAISPGQACVFYQGEVVVGGGWIEREDKAVASGQ